MAQRLVTVGIIGHWGENPNKKSEFYSVNFLVCFFLGLEQRNKYNLTASNYFYFPSCPTSFVFVCCVQQCGANWKNTLCLNQIILASF